MKNDENHIITGEFFFVVRETSFVDIQRFSIYSEYIERQGTCLLTFSIAMNCKVSAWHSLTLLVIVRVIFVFKIKISHIILTTLVLKIRDGDRSTNHL